MTIHDRGFKYLKGCQEEEGGPTAHRGRVHGNGLNAAKQIEIKSHGEASQLRELRGWNELLRKDVESPSWEVHKKRVDRRLSRMV